MRTIGVVTGARSDYGIYLPVLRRIAAEPALRLRLMVTGMHLSADFGKTVQAIEADGFTISDRVEMLLASDSPEAISKSMGLGVMGFAQAFARERPDLLLVLGDRFEMHSAALAALPFKIPVAHIHGGEVTHGAIDDALRHSLTKLSHLHFVSTDEYARRVQQMGEEAWRIKVSGAPALDNLKTMPLRSRRELEKTLGFALEERIVLVTFHPETLHYKEVEGHCTELLAALTGLDAQIIFTLPNADTGGRIITRLIKQFVECHPRSHMVENLGAERYFSLMQIASVMAGNSSSGIIEAPSFGLPVVNVGLRQAGRVRGANVLDVKHHRTSIRAALQQALHPDFRARLAGKTNPYVQANGAAAVIVEVLKSIALDDRLLIKKFQDITPLGH